MPRAWSPANRRKWLAGGFTAAFTIIALVVAPALFRPGNDNDALACNPHYFTDEVLGEVFASHPGMDGSSWETAHVFSGNATSGWTFYETTHYIIIQDCVFADAAWGIRLTRALHVRVLNCTFTNTSKGIWATEASDLGITGSSFVSNELGMYLWRTSNCTVARNEFAGNEVGIKISSGCSAILVYYNTFDAISGAADVAAFFITFSGNIYADYFSAHPLATMDVDHPEAAYCPLAQGAAFPLSEPVSVLPMWVDSRPLWYVPRGTPSISITNPANGSCHREAPVVAVTLAGTVLSNASYTLGGATFPIPLPATPSGTGTTAVGIDAPTFAALGEGAALLTAGVTSWFNETTITFLSLVKDTIAPVAALVSPANGSSHSSAPSVVMTVTDANPCNVVYEINGETRPAALPAFMIDAGIWASAMPGDVVIQVTITDAAGNGAEVALWFNKDVTGPVITAAWVSGNPLAGTQSPSFIANASDPAGILDQIQCTVGGISWNIISGGTTTIPAGAYASLADGAFAVLVGAHDTLGNPSEYLLAGMKDTHVDVLEVLAPLTGTVVSAEVVPYFALHAGDSSGIVSTWASLDGGLTTYPVPAIGYLPAGAWAASATAGGNVTVTFGAVDAAGNEATVSITLSVAADGGGPDAGPCLKWWCSPLFWAGSTFGIIAVAIIVAITMGSIGKAQARAFREGFA